MHYTLMTDKISSRNNISLRDILLKGEWRGMAMQRERFSKSDYESLAAFRRSLRRFLHFSEEGARAVGLTPQQHQLMLAIKGQPGKSWAHVWELAEALQIRHHAVVMLIDRCEKTGTVQRAADPQDRRQVRVSLTPEGEALLDQLSERNLRELKTLRRALQLDFLDNIQE
jgi:DNA-binding MarR family transcriptional regulator